MADSRIRGNSGSDATLVGSDEDEEAAVLCMKALGLLHDLWDFGQAPDLEWFWFEYLDLSVSRDEDGNVDIQFWWELAWILEQELGVEAAGPRGNDSSQSFSRKDNDPEVEQQLPNQDRPRSGSGDRYAEQQVPDERQAEPRELPYDAEHIPRLGNDFRETEDADEDMEDVPQWLILFLLADQNSRGGTMGRLRGGAGDDGKVEVSETEELWKLAKYYAEYHAKHFRDSSYHDGKSVELLAAWWMVLRRLEKKLERYKCIWSRAVANVGAGHMNKMMSDIIGQMVFKAKREISTEDNSREVERLRKDLEGYADVASPASSTSALVRDQSEADFDMLDWWVLLYVFGDRA
ncbi:hypothetical protein SLS56_006612 [Neofusicoccum ribis]|uniref:Uncharacterized protein n=1 Tax=Neofusicoccum ribis TaxID=45134 RepID=A0ABR3SQB5_9PEZI